MISEKGREDHRTNIIGLIPEDGSCQCELHGFEIDMDGNVHIPSLCPDAMIDTAAHNLAVASIDRKAS